MWNETMKEMIYFDNPQLIYDPPETRADNPKIQFAFNLAENSSLYFGSYKIVMQCVGKLDRDNKPIFEDDIIEFPDTEGHIFKKRIIWDDRELCYTVGGIPYEKLFNSAYIHRSQLNNCKILGNYYQNPELLEETNE